MLPLFLACYIQFFDIVLALCVLIPIAKCSLPAASFKSRFRVVSLELFLRRITRRVSNDASKHRQAQIKILSAATSTEYCLMPSMKYGYRKCVLCGLNVLSVDVLHVKQSYTMSPVHIKVSRKWENVV